jgi:uncharacterized protein YndB with AHSA1/START domain
MVTPLAGDDVVEVERRIEARPETVFSFFIDPERYRKWQGIEAELDPRPGGIFQVTVTGRSRTIMRGEFVEIDPPQRLVFTWGWEQFDGSPEGMKVKPGMSTVEVTLVPDGDGTIVRLRHSGLPTEAALQFHSAGWNLTIDRLVAVSEGRNPGPYPFQDI